MLLLPLMLIWIRDPMRFTPTTRWAFVGLALAIATVVPERRESPELRSPRSVVEATSINGPQS